MSTTYNIVPAVRNTLQSGLFLAVDGVLHRIICLINQLLTAGEGQPAQIHYFMKENSEKQAVIYAKPEVELIDINFTGNICGINASGNPSGNVTGQDPDDPTYA